MSEAIASVAFKYKWTHYEVLHLTVKQFCVYLRYIKHFEAYKQLRMFDAVIYPYLKKADREELMQKYTKIFSAVTLITKPEDVESSWQFLRANA